jgi:hypothetical protein
MLIIRLRGETNPLEFKRQFSQKDTFFETFAMKTGICEMQNGKNAVACQAVNRLGVVDFKRNT